MPSTPFIGGKSISSYPNEVPCKWSPSRMSRNLAHLSSSHTHLPTPLNPSFQTRTKNPHSLAIVNKAVLSNLHHFFASTKDSRETHVQLMRDQVLQVVLNNHGMNDVITKEVSNRTIAKHLSVSRQSVAKHRSNKIPFKKVQPAKKKPGLTKKAFIFTTCYANSW